MDNTTGKIWQRQGHGSNSGITAPEGAGDCTNGTYASSYCTYSWQNALKYCSNLTMDGKSDWRLPNVKELQSIVKYISPAPTIDTTSFLNTKSDGYWSATTYASSPTNAWVVTFYDGNVYSNTKSYSYYVRCVRGE